MKNAMHEIRWPLVMERPWSERDNLRLVLRHSSVPLLTIRPLLGFKIPGLLR
jgi:hypothetical protein